MSTNNSSFDWDNWQPAPDPDPIHFPLSGLSAAERSALIKKLENTAPYFGELPPEQEQETLNTHRSLRPSPEAAALIDTQKRAFQTALVDAVHREPILQNAVLEWEYLTLSEKKEALRMVTSIQDNICGFQKSPIDVYSNSKSNAAGENVNGTIGLNTFFHGTFASAVSTLVHENRHSHQRQLAQRLNQMSKDNPLKSAAEIYSVNLRLNRKGMNGDNNSFAHDAEAIESDSNSWGGMAHRTIDSLDIKTLPHPTRDPWTRNLTPAPASGAPVASL